MLEVKTIVEGLKELDHKWHDQNPLVEVESDSLKAVRLLNLENSNLFEVYFILFFVK